MLALVLLMARSGALRDVFSTGSGSSDAQNGGPEYIHGYLCPVDYLYTSTVCVMLRSALYLNGTYVRTSITCTLTAHPITHKQCVHYLNSVHLLVLTVGLPLCSFVKDLWIHHLKIGE